MPAKTTHPNSTAKPANPRVQRSASFITAVHFLATRHDVSLMDGFSSTPLPQIRVRREAELDGVTLRNDAEWCGYAIGHGDAYLGRVYVGYGFGGFNGEVVTVSDR